VGLLLARKPTRLAIAWPSISSTEVRDREGQSRPRLTAPELVDHAAVPPPSPEWLHRGRFHDRRQLLFGRPVLWTSFHHRSPRWMAAEAGGGPASPASLPHPSRQRARMNSHFFRQRTYAWTTDSAQFLHHLFSESLLIMHLFIFSSAP